MKNTLKESPKVLGLDVSTKTIGWALFDIKTKEVLELMNMYFISEEYGYKIIRLFKGFNFLFHGTSYCNSAYPIQSNVNISTKGIALRDIKAGEEILEWYTQNIDLANSK